MENITNKKLIRIKRFSFWRRKMMRKEIIASFVLILFLTIITGCVQKDNGNDDFVLE